jgi:hypothetical protein
MTALTLELPVAAEKPKTMSVKMPMDVIEAARIVSAYRGMSMTDLMGDILRPALAKMEQEEIVKRTKSRK